MLLDLAKFHVHTQLLTLRTQLCSFSLAPIGLLSFDIQQIIQTLLSFIPTVAVTHTMTDICKTSQKAVIYIGPIPPMPWELWLALLVEIYVDRGCFIYAAGSKIYIAGISLHSTVNCHNKFRHQGNECIILSKIGGISRAIFSTVSTMPIGWNSTAKCATRRGWDRLKREISRRKFQLYLQASWKFST